MPRLFTGLEIPEAIRLRLALIRAPLNGAKWIEAENMHITLRFVGDVDGRTADDFADALADIKAKPFALSIGGVGAFGGREPRVLWAGVAAGEEPAALYRAHERAARTAGLEPDARDFKPHVTLARLRRTRAAAVARFLSENAALRTEPFMVRRFVLLSARPGSGGGPYAVEAAYPFQGEDARAGAMEP
jgi:RNA 2',3'-cyclic 3'-phosphodiesterase